MRDTRNKGEQNIERSIRKAPGKSWPQATYDLKLGVEYGMQMKVQKYRTSQYSVRGHCVLIG